MDCSSKKHFYGVIKCGQEDTILESDQSYDPEAEDLAHLTSDVACNTRTRRKSVAIQTKINRHDRNFKNVYTNTNYLENDIAVYTESPLISEMAIARPVTSITKCIKSRSPEVTHVCDVKTTISINLLSSQDNSKCVAVDYLDLRTVKHRSVGKETPSIKFDKCVCTDYKLHEKCVEACAAACKKGITPCHRFTLGTAEYRRFQKDISQTKLIGGCRVPVCHNSKTRL